MVANVSGAAHADVEPISGVAGAAGGAGTNRSGAKLGGAKLGGCIALGALAAVAAVCAIAWRGCTSGVARISRSASEAVAALLRSRTPAATSSAENEKAIRGGIWPRGGCGSRRGSYNSKDAARV